MTVILNPAEILSFSPPFVQTSTTTLTLRNEDKSTMYAFKVKTTSPKAYCVRPNGGTIQAASEKTVQGT